MTTGAIELDFAEVGSRRVAYAQWGALDGDPIIVCHGTPGSRLGFATLHDRLVDAKIRYITYDRPGYGQSTRLAARQVVDCVGDIAAIADALSLDNFSVIGGSGGGPHALAAGARLADRVTRVCCQVGVAPWGVDDLDFLANMDPSNVKEFKWALEGMEYLYEKVVPEAAKLLEELAVDPAGALGDFALDDADRTVMADPRMQASLRASMIEAFANGVWGWCDDDLAFARPWGFDVEEVKVPTTVRYGAHDVLVPAAHGEWLAKHIAHASVIVDHEAGHMVSPDDRITQLTDFLATGK